MFKRFAILFSFCVSLQLEAVVSEQVNSNEDLEAIVFLIAGQSNAGGVAAFSPETNKQSGMAIKHPTIPGSTAKEVGISYSKEDYSRSYIVYQGKLEAIEPGRNLMTGYRDPNRHGIELPMAMLLQKQYPNANIYFIKHGPGGHNLHKQWAADKGKDYKIFMNRFQVGMTEIKKRHQKIKILGLYWDQGESDLKWAKFYESNLKRLLTALRKDTKQADLKVFLRKHLFQHHKNDFKPIIEAQVKVSLQDPDCHLLDIDLGTNDKNFKAWAWTDKNGHLSSKAYLKLSKMLMGIIHKK